MPDLGELTRSPAWYPLGMAPDGGVELVELAEADYRAASFLDERLLQRAPRRMVCEQPRLEQAAAQLVPRAHYLFHVGHVGSTLLARLIGEYPGFFSLREPRLLRLLADSRLGKAPLGLAQSLALLSRTWRPAQRAVIKATSMVNDLAATILDADPGAAAILIYADPLAYLRGIMAGENSRREIAALAPARRTRLARHLGAPELEPAPVTEGEQVAMSWLCEMVALKRAARGREDRTLWLNFDRFLQEPRGGLSALCRALGAVPTAAELEALLASPWMHRYSKAPEHAYDARLRREVLALAEREHGAEIRRGLAWLETVATRHPAAGLHANKKGGGLAPPAS